MNNYLVGDGLFFNNIMVSHDLVTRDDIGTSVSNALQCRTTVADCCTDSGTNTAQWFFPSGNIISTETDRNFYQVMGSDYVYLLRQNSPNAEGIFHCTIGPVADSSIVTEAYYVGVYTSGNGK